jgi:hypothetical protein
MVRKAKQEKSKGKIAFFSFDPTLFIRLSMKYRLTIFSIIDTVTGIFGKFI